jgi:hypothetical protein
MKILFVTESAVRRPMVIKTLKARFGDDSLEEVKYNRFQLDHQSSDPVSLVVFDMEPGTVISSLVSQINASDPAPAWFCIFPSVATLIAEGAKKMGALGCLHIPEYQLAEAKFIEPFLSETLEGLNELLPAELVA